MRLLLTICLLLAMLLAVPSWAQIAFDAATEDDAITDTASCSWIHTPVGTPKGILVCLQEANGAGDVISAVTYNGVSMTRVAYVKNDEAGEDGAVWAYFLGSSIPTGPQTVACTVDSGTSVKHGVAVSVTAGADTQLAGMGDGTGYCTVNSESVDDPSCTISSISAASYAFGCMWHEDGGPANITAGTGFTMRHQDDFGAQVSSVESRTSELASGDEVIAFNTNITLGGEDDVAMIGTAIEEVGGAPTYNPAAQQTIVIQ